MGRRNYTYTVTYGTTRIQAVRSFLQESSFSEVLKVAAYATLGRTGFHKKPKIFAVGMNKTATSSLHEVFLASGRTSYHGKRWRTGKNMWLLNGFDCFSDGPPLDFVELDKKFPGSKFILNVREFDDWALSRLKHIQRGQELQPGREYGPEWQLTEEAIEMWISHRDSHHAKVMRYFESRPEQLCIVNFIRDPSAMKKVSNFIGSSSVPEKPWANPGLSGGDPNHIELLERVLQKLKIPRSFAKKDLIISPEVEDEGLPTDTSELGESTIYSA